MYLHTVVDHYHADLTLYNNFNQSYEDCMHQYLMDTWKFIWIAQVLCIQMAEVALIIINSYAGL